VPARALQPVAAGDPGAAAKLLAALEAALAGGPAVLPLSADPVVAQRVLDAARPELGVPDAAAAVLASSGSTAEPKLVLLSADAMRRSADATHERLGGPGGWLLALPPHHVAGLQVVLRCLHAGTPLSTVDTAAGFTVAAFADAVRRMPAGRRYTSLVPTQLGGLLDAGRADVLAGFDAVLVGGAATPAAMAARAEAAGMVLRRSYGMSETCGGCVYDGVELTGVDVTVDASDGAIGAVRIGGVTLASGYLRDPGATAVAFAGGWFATRDIGRRGPGGRLDIVGRSDDVVVTGGEKVAPGLVERALRQVPGVLDACVVGVPDPRWGRVVAAVVVTTGPDDDLLREAVRSSVGSTAVPKRIRYADRLPMLASGKVDRRTVLAMLSNRP